MVLLALLLAAPGVPAQQQQQQQRQVLADPTSLTSLHPTASSGYPGAPLYTAPYLGSLPSADGSRWSGLEDPPCSEGPPRAGRARLQPYPRPHGLPLAPVLPPPRTALAVAPYPYASPRSDDLLETDISEAAGNRRGYYGHEVGYGSYFPIGLDPLTILAGLAFLAFIIQTLYLLLYKHYGVGLGGLGAGPAIGPLSADRHQRDEQQAWANTIASRIDSTASVYEGHSNATADSRPGAGVTVQDGEQQTDDEVDADAARQRRQMGLSPLDALLGLLRRSWSAPAHSCGPSWLCKLVYFARMLTEHLRSPGRNPGRATTLK
ncbi:uncharacterized protein LOC113203585 [Frankliniella occidentalis]|uniref:Uncharacterized protein LOC113203585 n=1 Tax=Frankliniella occidentalis TaxID=133901 RepID=A0A6J1RYW9_FRAOC|nr:uncharacterized protein LOC113203585 [Frankliniella occidentalis]